MIVLFYSNEYDVLEYFFFKNLGAHWAFGPMVSPLDACLMTKKCFKIQKGLVSEYKEFYSFKKHLKFLKTRKGYDYVYSLLDLYVKNSVANWYDLRNPGNYDNIKQFIRHKLSEL